MGNQFWRVRSSHGRKPEFSSPEQLYAAAEEYFEWVEANPLMEAKAFAFQGVVTVASLPKMRAMTIDGLCLFLGISFDAWRLYRARKDFIDVIANIETAIRTQKFTGAAADLLNANIISRDLGLSDKQAFEHSGPNGEPIEHNHTSAALELIESRLNVLASRNGQVGDA
jgi:hypothetical protein